MSKKRNLFKIVSLILLIIIIILIVCYFVFLKKEKCKQIKCEKTKCDQTKCDQTKCDQTPISLAKKFKEHCGKKSIKDCCSPVSSVLNNSCDALQETNNQLQATNLQNETVITQLKQDKEEQQAAIMLAEASCNLSDEERQNSLANMLVENLQLSQENNKYKTYLGCDKNNTYEQCEKSSNNLATKIKEFNTCSNNLTRETGNLTTKIKEFNTCSNNLTRETRKLGTCNQNLENKKTELEDKTREYDACSINLEKETRTYLQCHTNLTNETRKLGTCNQNLENKKNRTRKIKQVSIILVVLI